MWQLYLLVQGRAQLEHCSPIGSVLMLHGNTSSPDVYWGKWLNQQAHLELCHRNPNIQRGAKLDCVIQLNCKEVHAHASYETTRTWENFNNQGTKIILFSDKQWLIANNSNSFAIRSTSIIRSNLALCKHSQIYLI